MKRGGDPDPIARPQATLSTEGADMKWVDGREYKIPAETFDVICGADRMLVGLRHDGYDGDPARVKAAQILARMLTGAHADQVAKWLGWQLHDCRQAPGLSSGD